MRLTSEDSPGYEHQETNSYHRCSLCAESLDIDVNQGFTEPAPGRQMQGDQRRHSVFKVGLGYLRPCLRTVTTTKREVDSS